MQAVESPEWRPIVDRPLFTGLYTIGDAALYLRATTPPPDVPLSVWERYHKSFLGPSTRRLLQWIRRSLEWSNRSDTHLKHAVLSFEDLIRMRMIVILRARGIPIDVIRRSEE